MLVVFCLASVDFENFGDTFISIACVPMAITSLASPVQYKALSPYALPIDLHTYYKTPIRSMPMARSIMGFRGGAGFYGAYPFRGPAYTCHMSPYVKPSIFSRPRKKIVWAGVTGGYVADDKYFGLFKGLQSGDEKIDILRAIEQGKWSRATKNL